MFDNHTTIKRKAQMCIQRRSRLIATVAMTLTGSLLVVAITGSGVAAAAKKSATPTVGLSGGRNISGKSVLWDWQSVPSNSFGVPMLNGAKAAAKMVGLKLDVEYGTNSDTTESSQIKTAIAKHVAGYLVGVPDGGLNSALCAARATGAPVVSFNIDGASGKAATTCVQSFVGQSFVAAGETIANYMVSKGLIKAGDTVFCPVETPTQVYAVQRRQGVDNVLSKLGIPACTEIGTGDTQAPALTDMVNYLLGHHKTSAIIALGGTPLSEAPAAIKKVGIHIPIGGFDLSFPQIVTGIKDGAITASVNQEPYAQGYYGIMEIALALKYGIPPMNITTSDNALITKANVKRFASLVPKYQ